MASSIFKKIARAGFFMMMLAVAGCGGSQSISSKPSTPEPPTAPFIAMASVTINGTGKTILTTAPGITLYYDANDTSATIACTGSCTDIWRPLIFGSIGTPIPPPALTGVLHLVHTAKGNQLTYNGHPLYTYIQDSKAGDVKGDGIDGVWHVATATLSQNT